MKRKLKADLHTHTADDPYDCIDYSSEMLIDSAAWCEVEVLAVTCHGRVAYYDRLRDYAQRRGVLLIPGIEQLIEGNHVIILNPDPEQAAARSFDRLRALGKRKAAFLAPHPFYPFEGSLGRALIENIDLFDAIEYCNMYCNGLNFNRRAVRVARDFGLPVVGTSDTHTFPYSDRTVAWVEAEPTVDDVIEGVCAGRVQLETRPRPTTQAAAMALLAIQHRVRGLLAVLQ